MSSPVSPDVDAHVNPLDAGMAIKPAHTVLRQEIEEGVEQLARPARGLFLSAVSAGLDIGFGPLLVVTVLALEPAETTGSRFMSALAYSFGFLLVILGRSELFTEHTTLAVLPRLSKETTTWRVARLWGLVYSGNILGTIVFAGLASLLGLGLGLFDREAVVRMSAELLHHGTVVILGSAIAAGWLMGLVSWLVAAARDTIGQMLVIVFVTGSIHFLELHHSIAGSVEVLMGVFAAEVPVTSYLRFLALATVGNAVGGIVFVAVLKFSHIARSGAAGQP